jgi:predicted AAA+ superfamily ATPase
MAEGRRREVWPSKSGAGLWVALQGDSDAPQAAAQQFPFLQIEDSILREWLSVLEASYVAWRLPPYYRNFGKRLVKTPKLHFLDVGLMAYLLGIRDASSLSIHAQRGALFETWVIGELVKARFNPGRPADLYFWRDNTGREVDLLFETPEGLQAVEIKSGATFAADWLQAPGRWTRLAGASARRPWIVYGGEAGFERQETRVMGWRELAEGLDAA